MVIYDIEIFKAVPDRHSERLDDIQYCDGWNDKENMGVACICAYDTRDARYRVFTDGTFQDFQELVADRFVVGFNSITFDDVVCGHEGIAVKTSWDLLQEMWVADGLGREFRGRTHGGFGLDATAKANNVGYKTGYGGTAPVWWQRGRYGHVIDYCLNDVKLTWELVKGVMKRSWMNHPKDENRKLYPWINPLFQELSK